MLSFLNKQILTLFFVFYCGNVNCQEKVFNLDDVLSRVNATYEYKQIVDDSLIYDMNHKAFKANTLPHISINGVLPNYAKSISLVSQYDGSYIYTSQTYDTSELALQINQLIPWTGGILSFSTSIDRLDNLTGENSTFAYYYNIGKLSYKQSLFGFNEYKWIKRQDTVSKSLENVEYFQKIEGLKAKLVECFFSLLLEQRRRNLNAQNLQLSKYIYDRANLLYKDGRISKPDLMDTEIEYLKEKNLNNELNLKAAKDKFCQLLQLPLTVDPIISFNDSTEIFKNLDIDLGKVTDCAIEYNYNIPQKVKELGQTAQIKKISAENRPSVTLELGGGYNSQFKHFKDVYNGILSSRLASMTLSIPIYDGGAGKSRRKASEYQLKKMQDQFSIDKGDAVVGYTKDLMNVNIIIDGINSYKRILGLLDQQIGVIKMKVDYGRLEVEQYLRIKREETRAFVDYHNLIQDYYMYIYKYRSLSLIDIRNNKQIVSFSE